MYVCTLFCTILSSTLILVLLANYITDKGFTRTLTYLLSADRKKMAVVDLALGTEPIPFSTIETWCIIKTFKVYKT